MEKERLDTLDYYFFFAFKSEYLSTHEPIILCTNTDHNLRLARNVHGKEGKGCYFITLNKSDRIVTES